MTYSFDVFDTCLCRLCGEPRLVFDILSLKVQQVADEPISEHMRQLFVAARATAGGKNLAEIYGNVSKRYPLSLPAEKMIQLEMDIERQMLVPIHATLQLVNRLRKKGKILFISDMYLPSDFIREMLVEHGFFQEGDRLFVSDELYVWKRDGSLFRHIHDKEKIPYRRWHHYGDNHNGDFIVPRRLGIHAHYLHFNYLQYEKQWRLIPTLQFPYATLLAGVARAIRLSHDTPKAQKAFVCNVSAPIMLTWIVSLLEDCLCNGVERIYFLARDTHSEYVMARSLATPNCRYSHLSIHYLFVSTKSIDDKLCLDYFSQEGLATKTDKVAIVDSRGRGYFVNNINAMLTKGGYLRAKTYLLQLCPSPCDDQTKVLCDNEANILHNILYTQNTTNRADSIKNVGWMLENILSLNYHGKTIGYKIDEGKIIPVLTAENPEIVATNIEQMKKEQDDILVDYTKAFQKCGLISYNNNLMVSAILPTLTDFAMAPRKEYLVYLTKLSIYGKQNTYVHNIFQYLTTKGGHWQKGCIYYTFPRQIAFAIYKIYNKINKMLG